MAYNPNNPNGQATMANSAPVVIASNQSAVPITDNSGSITVDGSVTVSGTVTANAGTGTMNVSVQNASIPVTDNGGSLTVDGSISVSNFPATQAVSATNLDIRDLTSTDVVTVTGGAGQTADVKITLDSEQIAISNFPATQPVSGTVTIQDGGNTITVDGTVAATQSGTWSTRTQDGSGNAVTSHSAGASRGIDVSIIDGSGNQITSFGGGTQYTEGDVDTSITGTAIMWEDTSDTMRPVSATKPLPVNIVSGASSGTQYTDGAAVATPTGTVAMGTDGTNVYAIATDNGGNIGVNIQNTVNVSDGGSSITIDGTVTASQQASTAYRVIISDGTSDVPIDAAHADGETNTENHIDVGAKNLLFNGSTWDRVRGDLTNGMLVNLGANNDVTVTGTVTANAGTGSFTVAQATAANLNATVVGTGTFAVQASQSGTWTLGANSGVDIGDVTINNASGASAVNIQDGGNSITVDGTVTVTDGLNIEGDVAHDSIDSGNPVKIGFQAESSFPTAVATGDRANGISDVFGRQLVAHVDAGMQVWKGANYTTTQTGTDIWTPSAGKKICITYLAISSYATTSGRVILWFGASGDTTYTAGTDQLVWAGSFAPSANAKPGAIISLPYGITAVTADHRLKITTDAGISLDLTIYGYEC